jgi:hypothetical protein
VTRADLKGHHDAVLTAWRELILRAGSLGIADRIVVFIQLQYRGEQLSALEGLAQESVDLKRDTEAFVASVKQQSPVTSALAVYGAISGVLGFFGLWSFSELKKQAEPSLAAAEVGAAQTAAAVTGVLAVASSAVLYWLARGAFIAIQAAAQALNEFNARDHPSAAFLRGVQPDERALFALFGRPVPSRPISAGPLILLGLAGMAAGVTFAFLVGVGSSCTGSCA